MGARRRFDGKTVVVTGGAGGLGRAFAERFGRAGARLGLLDRDEKPLAAASTALDRQGVDHVALRCDVTDERACRSAVAAIVARFGGVDVLINNAGITHFSPFVETELVTYRRVMDVNFFGAVHATKAAQDSLIARRGLIITISSIAGVAPLYHRTGYAASKHALHGFFDSLRAELRPHGVDVLIVCPGFTTTGLAARALGGDGGPATRPQTRVGGRSTPAAVAEDVYRAATRSERLLVLTAVGRLTRWISRLQPALYDWLMVRNLKAGD